MFTLIAVAVIALVVGFISGAIFGNRATTAARELKIDDWTI